MKSPRCKKKTEHNIVKRPFEKVAVKPCWKKMKPSVSENQEILDIKERFFKLEGSSDHMWWTVDKPHIFAATKNLSSRLRNYFFKNFYVFKSWVKKDKDQIKNHTTAKNIL